MKLLLKGGRVIDPMDQLDGKYDILVKNGKIAAIGQALDEKDAKVFDLQGKIVAPGLIDMHVHLREPGQEDKETLKSGTQAAAAGGFTTVATMPNTNPVVDDAILVTALKAKAKAEGVVNVEVIGALTKGQQGKELAEVGDMAGTGTIAFSDDGHYVDSAKVLLGGLDYLRRFQKKIISHAEESTLVEEGLMNEGHKSAMLGLKGRPSVAEDIAVARDIMLAQYADAPIHIAHISSRRAVEIVRHAKEAGIKVTAEATPHHLTMTQDCVDFTDTSTKVNPPLRTAADNEALLDGLKDGTIDIIVTDHSPHAPQEKDREYAYAPSGFPGLETALGVLLTDLYHAHKIDLPLLIERMTAAPARVFGLARGSLAKGNVADITVIDTEKEWTVDAREFYTRGSHSPFVGRKLKGKAVMTIVNGKIIMQDGKVID